MSLVRAAGRAAAVAAVVAAVAVALGDRAGCWLRPPREKEFQQAAFRVLAGASHRVWQNDAWAWPPLARCAPGTSQMRPKKGADYAPCVPYAWAGFQGLVREV